MVTLCQLYNVESSETAKWAACLWSAQKTENDLDSPITLVHLLDGLAHGRQSTLHCTHRHVAKIGSVLFLLSGEKK